MFWGALACAVAFQALFYACTLYNSGASAADRLRRLDVLERALGPSAPGDPNLFAAAAGRLVHFDNLRQRLPLVLAAGAIWLAAFVFGDLCLLLLLPREEARGLERPVFAFGLGMGLVALAVQMLGLVGWLNRAALVSLAAGGILAWIAVVLGRPPAARRAAAASPPGSEPTAEPEPAVNPERSSGRSEPGTHRRIDWILPLLAVVTVTPFVLLAFLAACLPTTDFDALAYHLLGPKEYWLNGRIGRLPHNVYTHFPFHTEMFHLLAMTLLGDWRAGGLSGPLTIAMYGPATGAAVGLLAGRWFSPTAGWLAALVYLTTPWTYRLSAIAYVEGALLFYTTAALLAALRPPGQARAWVAVAGALAGFACACKYPGLVVAALPVGGILLGRGVWLRFRRRPAQGRSVVPAARSTAQVVALYVAGWTLAFGPWLVRNAIWTGNPVFPLAYRVFGGTGWSTEQADRFDRAHRSTDFSPATVGRYLGSIPKVADWEVLLGEIPGRSDWQSALVLGFAPFALLGTGRRRAAGLWLLVGYLFLVFWGLTHRLDRFWLPLEPFAAALAGAGLVWTGRRAWRALAIGSCLVGVVYNLAYCTTSLCGVNLYDVDLRLQWQQNVAADPAMAVCNQTGLIRPDQVVLHVGSAAVFYAEPRTLYNTVFDKSIFEQLVREAARPDLRSTAEIRRALAERRVEFLLVDWGEIARHRRPGGYGFSTFVRPAVFRALARQQVLEKLATPIATPTIVVWNATGGDAEPGDVVTAAEAARLPAGVETAERVELFRVLSESGTAP